MKVFVNKNWIVYKMPDKSRLDSCSSTPSKKPTGRNDKPLFVGHSCENGNSEEKQTGFRVKHEMTEKGVL
jgi:hypothetical protein